MTDVPFAGGSTQPRSSFLKYQAASSKSTSRHLSETSLVARQLAPSPARPISVSLSSDLISLIADRRRPHRIARRANLNHIVIQMLALLGRGGVALELKRKPDGRCSPGLSSMPSSTASGREYQPAVAHDLGIEALRRRA